MSSPRGDRHRLLYVIASSGVGGAEQQVRQLALAFRRRGWDVGVVSMLPLGPLLADLEGQGVSTWTLGMRRGVPDPRGLLRLRTILLRSRPDILHAHMVHANLLARMSRLLVRTPVNVSTMHSENQGRQWRYVAYRLTAPLADLTTAVSGGAVETAIRRGAAPAGKILLVPNGIATSAFRADSVDRGSMRRSLGLAGEFAWLAVGRLIQSKAYPAMISAFSQVRESHPDARLFIAGTGPLEQPLQELVGRAGLSEAITFLGLRHDVAALMRAADAFLMSSSWEGLPMVLLEAAASALPIVATDVGGSRDAVLDGISGYLVQPGDDTALAGAMQRMMALTAQQRAAMGGAGREHIVRNFDIEAIASRWEALYLGLLERAD